jgi:pilus assembly protein TadC
MSFFEVVMIFASILLAGAALRHVIVRSRLYSDAERELVRVLRDLSSQDESYYRKLIAAKRTADDFVAGTRTDRRSLVDANEFIAEIAEANISAKSSVRTITRILRHGSDRSKANYLAKLLAIDLGNPPYGESGRKSPDSGQPARPLAITKKPDRVRAQEH